MLNGNHKDIQLWRRRQQVEATIAIRPDLAKNNEAIKEYNLYLQEEEKKAQKRLLRKTRKAEKVNVDSKDN